MNLPARRQSVGPRIFAVSIGIWLGLLASSTSALPTNIALNKVYLPGSIGYFAKHNDAFDGNPSTSAGGGSDVKWGGALAVDFGSAKELLGVRVTFGETHRTAQWYKIQVSDDGKVWTDVLRVFNPQWPTDARDLPTGAHRYLRYVTGNCGAYRGDGESSSSLVDIAEIEVYERGAGDPAGTPPPTFPAALDRTGWKVSVVGGGAIDGVINDPDQGWADRHGGLSRGLWLSKGGYATGGAIQVDMGQAKDFNQVWYGPDHTWISPYTIQVSDNGSTWEPVATGNLFERGHGLAEPINFPMQHKRYWRFSGAADCKTVNMTNSCWWGMTSISALDSTGSTSIDSIGSVNVARGKTATSSVANAAFLVDGDESSTAGGEKLTLDLGQSYPIGLIVVKWASKVANNWFTISSSDDPNAFKMRQMINDTTATVLKVSPTSRISANYSARYLRFEFEQRQLGGGRVAPFPIGEVEVYQSASAQPVSPMLGTVGGAGMVRADAGPQVVRVGTDAGAGMVKGGADAGAVMGRIDGGLMMEGAAGPATGETRRNSPAAVDAESASNPAQPTEAGSSRPAGCGCALSDRTPKSPALVTLGSVVALIWRGRMRRRR